MKGNKRVAVAQIEKERGRPKESKRTKQQEDKVIGLIRRESVAVWRFCQLQCCLTGHHVKTERE